LPFALYWLARWAYFGDPLPNTFYAKDTFSPEQAYQGFLYVMQFAPFAWLLAGFFILKSLVRGAGRPEAWLLGGQLGLWLAYMLYSGGDHMPMYRFLVPVLPALALLLQEAFWAIARRPRRRQIGLALCGATVVAMTLLWLGPWTSWGTSSATYADHTVVREARRDLGLWLKANAAQGDVIAVSAAGAVPYFSELPAIDMLGLADRHIAHEGSIDRTAPVGHKRFDAAYVLDRQPAFIILANIAERGQPLTEPSGRLLNGKFEMAALPSNEALLLDARFWREYTRVRVPDLSSLAESHVVVVRNDRAAALAAAGLVEVVD
jgi:hypothetical protein